MKRSRWKARWVPRPGGVARTHSAIPTSLCCDVYLGQWSREQAGIPRARPHRPFTPTLPPPPPPARAAERPVWQMGGPRWGGGRLADTGSPAPAAGQSGSRQRRGQHLSLLARPPLFSTEAAAAANCHGHQVTGTRRRPTRAWATGGLGEKGAEGEGWGWTRETAKGREVGAQEQEWGPERDGRGGLGRVGAKGNQGQAVWRGTARWGGGQGNEGD